MNKIQILLLLVLFNSIHAYTQTDQLNATIEDSVLFTPDFFDKEEPLRMELKFNIKEYKSKNNKSKIFPAKLSYYIKDSIKITKVVSIEMRGISRQKLCDFPPFFIKLKNSGINRDHIAGEKKLKVVALCKNQTGYREYLIKEYLIYKLYNIITDNSFRVRLINITLIDEGRKNKSYNRIFFIIEPEELLAQRLNAIPIKRDEIGNKYTDPYNSDIMFMFQYMIGNTDFSISGRHNIKLIKFMDHKKPLLIPIPYDFDFAGIINTEYARPPAFVDQIERVTDRYYMGVCRQYNDYLIVISYFKDHKIELYSYINSLEFLPKKHKKRMINYLDEFYNLINNPKFIDKELMPLCED